LKKLTILSNIMERIALITPGGDAPGINSAIGTIIHLTRNDKIELIGINDGYKGLIDVDFCEMKGITYSWLMGVSGTILHCERMHSFKEEKVLKKASKILKNKGIEGLIVIGGNGSFKGALDLFKFSRIPTVAIPATIDNDIYGTDETIGFDTACNTALEAINRIKDTAVSFERIFLVEVMGRDRGFIALEVGIASGAEAVLIPEVEPPLEEIAKGLKRARLRGNTNAIIVAAEGVSKRREIAKFFEDKTGAEVRVSVLGYIQRGGSPTRRSRMLGVEFASYAYEILKESPTRPKMVGLQSGEIVTMDLEKSIQGYKEIDIEKYKLHRKLSNIY